MPLLTLPQARERLDPLAEKLIVKPCTDAVTEYGEFVAAKPRSASAISATTRAGMIHDFTTRNVRGAVTKAARELDAYGFFAVLVKDDLAVRFKFLGSGQPSNVATGKQVRLSVHQYDDDLVQALAIEGVYEPPTLVTCGYALGGDGEVQSLVVQLDYGKQTVWRYYLYGEPGVSGNYEYLPLDPDDTLLGAVVVRSSRKDERADREAK